LIRRLLEYQKYREAAKQLGDRPSLGREVFRRGVPMDPVDPKEIPFAEVSTFALISALSEVLNRSQVKLTHDVVVDRISITDRINHIVDRLLETENVRFADCFNFSGSTAQIRHDVIVTFLAILEMARLRMICIRQESSANEIILFRTTDLRTVSQEVQEDYS
jgi:segregation and condensation protein A